MDIRFADKHDIPVIQQLAYHIWPIAYNNILLPEQITYMLNLFYAHSVLEKQFQDGLQFLIAEDKNLPIGFAAFSKKTSDTFHLQKLYILPDFHGNGIGKTILQYIRRYIKIKGATAIELNVNRENSAVNFYKKLNFKIISCENIDIGNGFWMNDYVMRSEIN